MSKSDAGKEAGGSSRGGLLALIGPGLLVAATGVGAGDLAGAGIAGSKLGVAVAWAIVVGALMKVALTEGLTRWQIATGSTVVEGICRRIGPAAWAVFGLYLLAWSLFVGAALVRACGVSVAAGFDRVGIDTSPFALGLVCSIVGAGIIWFGGFKAFEKIMAACVGLMTVIVLLTAALTLWHHPAQLSELVSGLTIPRVPEGGLGWTIALIGGVGGTLTIVCYGYWIREEIREEGREGKEGLRVCRIDLSAGYTLTALFGLGVLVIASGMELDGRGASLIINLTERLRETLGGWAGDLFLIGTFAAVFSSLLGVWQSVPYVFADWLRLTPRLPKRESEASTRSWAYRGYLLWLAIAPVLVMRGDFASIQKWYGIAGAFFVPLLAAALLFLCSRREMGAFRSGPLATAALVISAVSLLGITLYQQWPRIAALAS